MVVVVVVVVVAAVVVVVGQSLKAFEAKCRPRRACSLDARAFTRVSPFLYAHTHTHRQLVATEDVLERVCVYSPTYACLEKPVVTSFKPVSNQRVCLAASLLEGVGRRW